MIIFFFSGRFIKDKSIIKYYYLTSDFVFDFLSFIPLDVICLMTDDSMNMVNWLKVSYI